MARVYVCVDCSGTGARTYERGQPVERCTTCHGAGLILPEASTAAHDLRDLVTSPGATSPELLALGPGAAVRALSVALAVLEDRVAALEAELARPR